MTKFFVGLDLGQAADYTAFAVLEQVRTDGRSNYHVRHLERPELGTSYIAIVERAVELAATDPLKGNARLVVDFTGVGRPVRDLLIKAKLRPVAITITGGDTATHGPAGWRVPKRDLASCLQLLFQSERIKVARALPFADVLVQELLAFRAKIDVNTGHDSYESWREGTHDDLVLAMALAAWYAERATSANIDPESMTAVSRVLWRPSPFRDRI